MDNLKKWGA
jgi:hypothetical protein